VLFLIENPLSIIISPPYFLPANAMRANLPRKLAPFALVREPRPASLAIVAGLRG